MSRIWRLFCDINQAWLHKSHKLKCELRKRHFWFFRDPKIFYGELRFEEGMVFYFQKSTQQGDLGVF